MRSRGIDVRPLPDLTDPARADFNQVYFDGVEVPREHLVGREGGGWEISTGSLAHERGMLWTMQVGADRAAPRGAGRARRRARAGRPAARRGRALSRPAGSALDRRPGPQVHGLPRLREGRARPRRARAFADEAARQRARAGDLPVRGRGAGPRRARRRLGAPRRGSPSSRSTPPRSTTCARSPTRSPAAPRRSSATSSPSACCGCRGARSDAGSPVGKAAMICPRNPSRSNARSGSLWPRRTTTRSWEGITTTNCPS